MTTNTTDFILVPYPTNSFVMAYDGTTLDGLAWTYSTADWQVRLFAGIYALTTILLITTPIQKMRQLWRSWKEFEEGQQVDHELEMKAITTAHSAVVPGIAYHPMMTTKHSHYQPNSKRSTLEKNSNGLSITAETVVEAKYFVSQPTLPNSPITSPDNEGRTLLTTITSPPSGHKTLSPDNENLPSDPFSPDSPSDDLELALRQQPPPPPSPENPPQLPSPAFSDKRRLTRSQPSDVSHSASDMLMLNFISNFVPNLRHSQTYFRHKTFITSVPTLVAGLVGFSWVLLMLIEGAGANFPFNPASYMLFILYTAILAYSRFRFQSNLYLLSEPILRTTKKTTEYEYSERFQRIFAFLGIDTSSDVGFFLFFNRIALYLYAFCVYFTLLMATLMIIIPAKNYYWNIFLVLGNILAVGIGPALSYFICTRIIGVLKDSSNKVAASFHTNSPLPTLGSKRTSSAHDQSGGPSGATSGAATPTAACAAKPRSHHLTLAEQRLDWQGKLNNLRRSLLFIGFNVIFTFVMIFVEYMRWHLIFALPISTFGLAIGAIVATSQAPTVFYKS